MDDQKTVEVTRITVSPEWWEQTQRDIRAAADLCQDIVGHIEAHWRHGVHSVHTLLEMIEGEAREARELLEARESPI